MPRFALADLKAKANGSTLNTKDDRWRGYMRGKAEWGMPDALSR